MTTPKTTISEVTTPGMTDSHQGSEGVRGGSGAMFDRIAERYDLLNRLLSGGVDRRWRRRTVEALEMRSGDRVLDLATGTGDVLLEVLSQQSDARLTGLDPSAKMLEIADRKLARVLPAERYALRRGDAERLPFEDDSFDRLTIAFGIRNVPDRNAALREMARVTRPDGRIAILELSEPRNGLISHLARFHIHTLVPKIGSWLSGAQEYRYLERSIAAFPSPQDFADQMVNCGLEVLEVIPRTFGVACTFLARPAEVAS